MCQGETAQGSDSHSRTYCIQVEIIYEKLYTEISMNDLYMKCLPGMLNGYVLSQYP